MTVNVDPSVSLLISNIRNAKNNIKKDIMIQEFKKLLSKDNNEIQSEYTLWKKLFFVYKGYKIHPLDFIKACASKSKEIKRLGYQGIVELDCKNELVLMCNTLLKDLKNNNTISEALIFLSNLRYKDMNMINIVEKIEIPPENSIFYRKSIVVVSKYKNNNVFNIESTIDLNLFVKLQIILDSNSIKTLLPKENEYLINKFMTTPCVYTKIKILHCFNDLLEKKIISLSYDFVFNLKENIQNSTSKVKNPLDIALSIEIIKILIISKNICEKVEEFIFKLISNNNSNLKHIGYKIISKYKIISEIAINQILESGLKEKFYFTTISSLVTKFNYKIIYEKIVEFIINFKNENRESKNLEKYFFKIILQISNFANQDFIKEILCKFPETYLIIKSKNKLRKDILYEIYNIVKDKKEIKYFIMIYYLIKKLKIKNFSKIIYEHLKILSDNFKYNAKIIFDFLIDLLCTCDNIGNNRELIKNYISSSYSNLNKDFLAYLTQGFLRFNLILPVKILYIKDNCFIEYSKVESDVIFKYDMNKINIEIFKINPCDFVLNENKNEKVLHLDDYKNLTFKITYNNNELFKEINLSKI